MAKFKVGDRAKVICGANKGFQCVIVEVGALSEPSGFLKDYRIDVPDNPHPIYYYWTCDESSLEPILNLGSWDEIEESIGWNPTKTTEKKEINYSSSSSAIASNVGSSY